MSQQSLVEQLQKDVELLSRKVERLELQVIVTRAADEGVLHTLVLSLVDLLVKAEALDPQEVADAFHNASAEILGVPHDSSAGVRAFAQLAASVEQRNSLRPVLKS